MKKRAHFLENFGFLSSRIVGKKLLRHICYMIAVMGCFFPKQLSGQNYTWTGADGNQWSNSANWSPTGVPSGGTTEVIFNGTGNGNTAIALDMEPTLSTLLFDSGNTASYTIGTAGQTLQISWESQSGSQNSGIQVAAGVTNNQTILADIYYSPPSEWSYQTQITNNSSAALNIEGDMLFNPVAYEGALNLQSNGAGINTISGSILASTAALAVGVNYYSDAGTWQLLGTNTFSRGLTVTYGTLVINSIANINEPCSLGISGDGNTTMILGTANLNTTLRYIGPDASSNRPWISEAATGTFVVFDVVSSLLTMNGQWTSGGGSAHPGLQKTGAGTLQLNATNNNYGGPTLISEGVLGITAIANGGQSSPIGKSSADASNLIFDGGTLRLVGSGEIQYTDRAFTITDGKIASFDMANSGSGLVFNGNPIPYTTGGISLSGNGSLMFVAQNAYTGPTTVTGGTLIAGSSSTVSGGPFGINSDVDLTSNGALSLNLTYYPSGNPLQVTIGSLSGLPGSTVSLNSSMPEATQLSGTLTIASSQNATFGGVISDGFGSGVQNVGLLKTTPSPTSLGGMQTLTGNNTYGGATYIQSAAYADSPISEVGGITLSGANGSIASSWGIVISGGATLAVENFGTDVNTNRIGDTASVTMMGGTLSFSTDSSAPSVSETLGALVLNGQNNTISNGQAEFGKTSTLTFASLVRNGSALVNFAGTGLGLNNQNRILFTSAPTLGGWALYNGVGYAAYDLTNGIVEAEYVDVTRLSSGSKIIYSAPEGNIRVIDGTGTPGLIELGSANTEITALVQSATGGPVTIDTAGKTFEVATMLVGAGAESLIIGTTPNSGALTSTSYELSLINNSTNNLLINAMVVDNTSPVGVTKMGMGTAYLAGNNTYTGVTTLGQGNLSISMLGNGGMASGIGAAGNATSNIVFSGGSLHYTGNSTTTDRGLTVSGEGSSIITDADIHFSGAGINLGSGSLTIGGAGNTTISSLIAGGGALHKDGHSTLVLEGMNTFTGGVKIRDGVVSVTTIELGGQAGNLGAASNNSTNLVFDGGSLVYSGSGMVGSDRGMMITENGGRFSNATPGAFLAFSSSGGGDFNNVHIAPGGVFTVDGAGTIAFGSIISGAGALQKTGEGLLILENPANTFTGGVTMSGGTFVIDGISNGGVAGFLGAASAAPSNLVFDGGGFSFTPSGPMQAQTTDRGFTINAGKTATINVESGASLAFTGSVPVTTGSLVKTGLGSLSLGGNMAYTGNTTVAAGTLLIDGSTTAASSLTVASGATLGGNGTIGGNVVVNGSIAPGDAGIGTLTTSGNVTWESGQAWRFELGSASGLNDSLHLAGAGSQLLKGSGSSFLFDFSNTGVSGTFSLITWTGSTQFQSSDFSYTNLASGLTGNFSITGTHLEFTTVPEPSTWGLLAITALLLLKRRLFKSSAAHLSAIIVKNHQCADLRNR